MAETVQNAADIQKAPKQPVGNPPLSNDQLTQHLDNFELPAQVTNPAKQAADDALKDFKLPKSLKGAYAILEEVKAIRPADQIEDTVKRAKLDRIAALLHELAQGAKELLIPQIARADITGAQSVHADALKLDLLARSHPEVKRLVEKFAAATAELENLKK